MWIATRLKVLRRSLDVLFSKLHLRILDRKWGGVEQDQFNELSALVHDVSLIPMSDRWKWDLESLGDFFVTSREAPEDNDLRGVNSTSYIVHVSVLSDHETSSKQYESDRFENVKVDLWRRLQSALVRRVEALVVEGLRRKGRPKLRWEDRLTQDMKDLLLSEDMTLGMREERELTFAGSVV
ncbi:hypothetical protein Tco_0711823 [Tanacetum coccineum]